MSTSKVTPDPPRRAWRALLALLARMPQGALSRSFGRIADIPIPRRLRRPILTAFARAAGIDLSEAELPVDEYPSLDSFFVRRLRDGARHWPGDDAVLASPVDGIAGQIGEIHQGRLLQAKGRWYSAAALLADPEPARRFEGGTFVTLYLSPRHYHRIHAPRGGRIPLAVHIPGSLMPVNAPAVAHIPDLFPRNERLLCYLESGEGAIAVVAVGAFNVGRISAAFDDAWGGPIGAVARTGHWAPDRRRASVTRHVYSPPISVTQGDEIMAFHLGSTVVMLLEPGHARLAADLAPGMPVRLGQPLVR